jgi:hypothetical protein
LLPFNPDFLDLIERPLFMPVIVELRRFGAGVVRHRLADGGGKEFEKTGASRDGVR